MACALPEFVACPVRGTGEVSEPFIEELGRHLDDEPNGRYEGSWRQFAQLLLDKCDARALSHYEGRSRRDPTNRRSPTWEVWQDYRQKHMCDIAMLWRLFYYGMGREDIALLLVTRHEEGRLLYTPKSTVGGRRYLLHPPNLRSSYHCATQPPQEVTDIASSPADRWSEDCHCGGPTCCGYRSLKSTGDPSVRADTCRQRHPHRPHDERPHQEPVGRDPYFAGSRNLLGNFTPPRRSAVRSKTTAWADTTPERDHLLSRDPKQQCPLPVPQTVPVGRNAPSLSPGMGGASNFSDQGWPSQGMYKRLPRRSPMKWRRQDSQGWSDATSETDNEPQETENEVELWNRGEPREDQVEVYTSRRPLRAIPTGRLATLNCRVGVSFHQQDTSLAKRVQADLMEEGCQSVILINRSTMNQTDTLDAIIVIFTRHYKKTVIDKNFHLIVNSQRFVYNKLWEEWVSNAEQNQRCVFYPEMTLAKSTHVPGMFLQDPIKPKALAVYHCLYEANPNM